MDMYKKIKNKLSCVRRALLVISHRLDVANQNISLSISHHYGDDIYVFYSMVLLKGRKVCALKGFASVSRRYIHVYIVCVL